VIEFVFWDASREHHRVITGNGQSIFKVKNHGSAGDWGMALMNFPFQLFLNLWQ
jgi:hypothetical protein